MLAVGVLEREPDISDDDLLDVLSWNLWLHRLSEHHQGRARGGQGDAKEGNDLLRSILRRGEGAARQGELARRSFDAGRFAPPQGEG